MAHDEARAAIARHDWWHTIELAPGLVTPGVAALLGLRAVGDEF